MGIFHTAPMAHTMTEAENKMASSMMGLDSSDMSQVGTGGHTTMSMGMGSNGQGTLQYQGVDIGAYVDFDKIFSLIQDAIAKVPAGMLPQGSDQWAYTVVMHPQTGEGAAWGMQPNP